MDEYLKNQRTKVTFCGFVGPRDVLRFSAMTLLNLNEGQFKDDLRLIDKTFFKINQQM